MSEELEGKRRRAGEMLLRNRAALADALPETRTPNLLGKIWNSPNTAVGLVAGGVGHAAAELRRLLPGDQPDPRIQFGHNAVEFVNNPAGGVSAITLGNATIYSEGVNDPRHEEQHTYQGELLGPAYLPSNLAGGLRALVRDGSWHGKHNWNERGPQQPRPVPWSRKAPPE